MKARAMRVVGAVVLWLATACSSAATSSTVLVAPSPTPASTAASAPKPDTSPSPDIAPRLRGDVYAAITDPQLASAVRGIPTRVYVPNNDDNTVSEIDPKTFRVIRTVAVGREPEHVSPSWDLRHLYVGDVYSNQLTEIDPKSGKVVRTLSVPDPYNLYFTPDGRFAIDVAEGHDTLYLYDPKTWKLRATLRVPFRGPDHLDFSADGTFFLISTEYAGVVCKVSLHPFKVADTLPVGGSVVDVKLAPQGDVFYAANQQRSGVSVIDPVKMREIGFIATGTGAHGMAIARDAIHLYVANRLADTISVIDTRTRKVVHTWHVGGSPDMLQVSADGTQLWASNRFDRSVSVIDTRTGKVLHVIAVGGHPHGLTLFPQPGRFSLGHNGVYR